MSSFFSGPSIWFRGECVLQATLLYSSLELFLDLLETEFLFVLAMEMLKCNIGALNGTTKRKQIGRKVIWRKQNKIRIKK